MKNTILVVDDDPVFIELIAVVLGSERYDVITARNGKEALEVLTGQAADVIVSDVEMPLINGMDLHTSVAHDERLKHIPFIFITGSEDPAMFTYLEAHPSIVLVEKMNMVDRLLPEITRAIERTQEIT